LAAHWQRAVCPSSHSLTSSGTDNLASSVRYIADRWQLLPPHVREAVITLIDAACLQHQSDGGRL
jgi:hypothetical protein